MFYDYRLIIFSITFAQLKLTGGLYPLSLSCNRLGPSPETEALCDRGRCAELDHVHCGSRVCLVLLLTKCASFTKLPGRSVAVSHSVDLVGKLKLLQDPLTCTLYTLSIPTSFFYLFSRTH